LQLLVECLLGQQLLNPSESNRYITRQDTSAGGITANTISFTAATKTIADTGSGFGVFNVGEQIVVTGSTSNNGNYTISSVTPSAIVVNENLVNETAGANVTITSPLIGRVIRTNASGLLPFSIIPPLSNVSDVINLPLGEDITVSSAPVPVMILNTSNPLHRCQSYNGSTAVTNTITPSNFVGQTFTTGNTTTKIRFIRVLFGFFNPNTVNWFRARLFATSGGVPTGSALAEANPYTTATSGAGGIFKNNSFNSPLYTQSDLNFFDFGEVNVSPNTQYAIVFSVDGGSLNNGSTTTNPYSGGTLVTAPSLSGPWSISSSDDIPLDIFEYDGSNNFIVVRARPPFNNDFNYRRLGSSAGTLPTFPLWGCDGFITQSGVAGDVRQVVLSGNLPGFSGLTPNEEYFVNGVGTIGLGGAMPKAGVAINSTTLRIYPSTSIQVNISNPVSLYIVSAGGISSYNYTKSFYTMYSKYLNLRPSYQFGLNGFSVGASASNTTGTYSASGDIFGATISYSTTGGFHDGNHTASGFSSGSFYAH